MSESNMSPPPSLPSPSHVNTSSSYSCGHSEQRVGCELTADHVNSISFFFFFASTKGASAHGDVVHLGVNNPAYNEIQHNYALRVTSRA